MTDKFMSVEAFFAVLCLVVAGAAQAQYNPFFAKVGTTIYVSGPSSQWSGQLAAAQNELVFAYDKAPVSIEKIVFVNATSTRPERTDFAQALAGFIQRFGISTVAVGSCDLTCARIFSAGKTRQLGTADGLPSATIAIQPPLDPAMKRIETKFPAQQVSFFVKTIPALVAHEKIFTDAFSAPSDDTGGLFITAADARFCASTKTNNCKYHSGMNAHAMGITTSPDVVRIALPARFPAPVPTGADINDVAAFPKKPATYEKFLSYPAVDRAIAIAVDPAISTSYYWSGGDDPVSSAIKNCEDLAKTSCRLYAAGKDVF